MSGHRAKILDGGRIIVPAALRQALGLAKGDTVYLDIEGDALRVRPAHAVVAQLQAKLRCYAPDGVSLADDLIAERRDDARRS